MTAVARAASFALTLHVAVEGRHPFERESPVCTPGHLRRTVGTLHSIGPLTQCSVRGTVMQPAKCTGAADEQFRLNPAGDLVIPSAHKCVDVKDQQTDNGTRLQVIILRSFRPV